MKNNKKQIVISAIAMLILFLGAFATNAFYQYRNTIAKIDEYLNLEYQKGQSYRIYAMTAVSDFDSTEQLRVEGLSVYSNDSMYIYVTGAGDQYYEDGIYYTPDEEYDDEGEYDDEYSSGIFNPLRGNEYYESYRYAIACMEMDSIYRDKELRDMEPNTYVIRTCMVPLTEEADTKYGLMSMKDFEALPEKPGIEEMAPCSYAICCDPQGDIYLAFDSHFYFFFKYRACFQLPEGKTYDLQELEGSGTWRVQGAFGEEAEALQKNAESISKSGKKSGFSGSDRYLVISPSKKNLQRAMQAMFSKSYFENKSMDQIIATLEKLQANDDDAMLMDQILFYDWTEEKAALTRNLTIEGLLLFAVYVVALAIVILVTHFSTGKAPVPEEEAASDIPLPNKEEQETDKKLDEILAMIDKIEGTQGPNGYLDDLRSEIKSIREPEDK